MTIIICSWIFLYFSACYIMRDKLVVDVYECFEEDEDGQTREILLGWIRRVLVLQFFIWPRSLMNYFRNRCYYKQEIVKYI